MRRKGNMVVSAIDLAHGVGGATVGMSRVEGLEVVAAEDQDVMKQVIYRANYPGTPKPKKRDQFDLAFVHKWTRRAHRVIDYNVKAVIALAEPPRDVWARYRWTSFDMNCSFYGVPQHKLIRFYVGLANGTPEELEKLADDVQGMASPSQARVCDLLPSVGLYFLHPACQLFGRGVFSSSLPSPALTASHWPLVVPGSYKPRVADSRGDPSTAISLDEAQFGVLQCMPPDYKYPGAYNRQDKIKAIVSTVPPPVVTAVTRAVVNYLANGRCEPMDCSPLSTPTPSRFEVMAKYGEQSEFKGDRLQVVYTIGTSAEGDRTIRGITDTGTLQPGWKVFIRQTADLKSDEVSWRRPHGGQIITTAKRARHESRLIAQRRQRRQMANPSPS